MLKLFLEIKKYAPAFESEILEKEKIWSKLFQGKEYNYGVMKNLIFDLNQLAELFIADLKYGKDESRHNEYLMNALLDRDLNRLYKVKFRSFSCEPDLKLINANNLNVQEHFYHVNSVYHFHCLCFNMLSKIGFGQTQEVCRQVY